MSCLNEKATKPEKAALLSTALSALVNKLDQIHEDPAYKSVWIIHQMHVGPYRGPTYVAELDAARAALKDAQGWEE
jgi:hypothetical protein